MWCSRYVTPVDTKDDFCSWSWDEILTRTLTIPDCLHFRSSNRREQVFDPYRYDVTRLLELPLAEMKSEVYSVSFASLEGFSSF